MNQRIPVTIVNHVAVDIAATADAIWSIILEEFVEAKGFRRLGTVAPLNSLAAPLGGHHMHLDYGDGILDERIVHFTEHDHVARRLSIFADYLSVSGSMKVYVTYHAQETPTSARFAVDCHTSVEIDVPIGATCADVAAIVAKQTTSYNDALTAHLQKVRTRLEGAA